MEITVCASAYVHGSNNLRWLPRYMPEITAPRVSFIMAVVQDYALAVSNNWILSQLCERMTLMVFD